MRNTSTSYGSVRSLPLLSGSFAILIGAIAVVTWPQSVNGGRLALVWTSGIRADAAVGFILCGTGLFLAWFRVRHPVLRTARGIVEAMVLGLALAPLLTYWLGIDLSIDRLLIDRYALPRDAPEEMPASTALALGLCAASLSSEHLGGRAAWAASRACAALVGIIGLLTLIGHLYGEPTLYRPFGGPAMAVHAAVTFMALAVGLVALRPEHGLTALATRATVLGAHLRWLFPAAILIPLLMGGIAVQAYETFGIPRLAIAITAAGTTISIGLALGLAALSLRRMENRLELASRALAGAGQGVLIADGRSADHPIRFVNTAFEAISGYLPEEALGRPYDFFFDGIAADSREVDQIAASLRDGKQRTVVFQARRRDGTVFSCRLSISGVSGSDNRTDHFIALIEDVTGEQLAAKARLELLAEAAQARKEAEAANSAREIFLASVTHDLRSPLNACLMWADVLALGPLSESSAKAVDTIKRNLKLQARLVNDLIDTAKMASGGIDIHVEELDLIRLVDDCVDTWRLIAQNKNITLDRHVELGSYRVNVDAERMVQVLNNLLENACSFTPENGNIDLHVSDENDFVVIRVSDDGIGLDNEELRMLFTPFWRGKKPDNVRTGLGLGLTIAEHLMRRHDGTLIAASSGPGKGSTFTARLPRSVTVGGAARTLTGTIDE
jgi:PAS domain S-box-containing protein